MAARLLLVLLWLTPCGALAQERSEARSASGESASGGDTAADAGAASYSDDPLPWFVLGLSATVMAAGGMMLGFALADINVVENAAVGTRWGTVEDAYRRSEGFSIAGFVLAGVGLAGTLVGTVWIIVDDPAPADARAALSIGPGSAALAGTW